MIKVTHWEDKCSTCGHRKAAHTVSFERQPGTDRRILVVGACWIGLTDYPDYITCSCTKFTK